MYCMSLSHYYLLYCCSSIYTFSLFFFFFNDTATTEIYTLSLHDALPIWGSTSYSYAGNSVTVTDPAGKQRQLWNDALGRIDRKSTRLNSSHANISYAVFCLKKKKKKKDNYPNEKKRTSKHYNRI